MISENQGPIETHWEKDEKDIPSIYIVIWIYYIKWMRIYHEIDLSISIGRFHYYLFLFIHFSWFLFSCFSWDTRLCIFYFVNVIHVNVIHFNYKTFSLFWINYMSKSNLFTIILNIMEHYILCNEFLIICTITNKILLPKDDESLEKNVT